MAMQPLTNNDGQMVFAWKQLKLEVARVYAGRFILVFEVDTGKQNGKSFMVTPRQGSLMIDEFRSFHWGF